VTASDKRSWLEVREVGATWGMVSVVRVATALGRFPARFMLRFIVAYYFAFSARARASSREYLERLGQPATAGAVYRHLLRFAQCALDRLFFLRGQFDRFEFTHVGHEYLEKLAKEKRGAFLLGAHLGSFEALRASGMSYGIPVNVVANFANAKRINEVLSRLGSDSNTRFIDAGGSPAALALAVRDAVERGELVAILADRAGDGRSVEVPFLGGNARFPTGAFVLAATLGCPVYLTFGLHFPPNRYTLHCEPFAEQVRLPRTDRQGSLESYVRKYAERLEHYCRLAPDNWFNFFDFWSKPHVR
jgi:predicted LPLAT superfamily acyltransferase